MLNRKEFINIVKEKNPEKTKSEIGEDLDMILNGIVEACRDHDGVRFMTFGTFSVKEYDSRIARNPKTMEDVEIPPYRTIRFKVGTGLKEAVN